MTETTDIPGATSATYVTPPLTTAATYAVRVSNAYGSVLSAPAIVTIEVTYQGTVIADGASAYWPLDDPSGTTARDLMGTYDGTISGGVTLDQPGVTADSRSMAFGGTGKILTAAEAITVPAICSFEWWVNTAAPGRAAISGRTAGGFDTLLLYVGLTPAGVVRFYGNGEFGGVEIITDSQWHHVVCVQTGTTAQMYVDGVLDNSLARTFPSDTGQLSLGFDLAENYGLIGSLQDVAIYPRALTPAEILAHYHLRVPAPAFPPGLVSYWSFDSGWNDQVGTNHLTNNGGVTSVAGKLGNAGDFESSSSQYLSHADPTPLGDEDFTYALWFKRESIVTGQTLIGKDHETGRSYQLVILADGRVQWVVYTVSNVTSGNAANDTAWHFVVVWHDATADLLGITLDDMAPVTFTTSGLPPVANGTTVAIGARTYSGNLDTFDGLIDEVGLWRRVLTAEERTALWNGGAGLPYVL